MLQDLRFGFKLLWKEKGFTITALLTLALCIGANTAIFTVLHAVILAPLPFAEPERLVAMGNIYPGVGVTKSGENSIPDYLDRRKMTDVFESVAMFKGRGLDAGPDGSPVRVQADEVTPSYFQVLGAAPMMGRLFTESDAAFQKSQFVILSYGVWKDMFGTRSERRGQGHSTERRELPRRGRDAGQLSGAGARGAFVDSVDVGAGPGHRRRAA